MLLVICLFVAFVDDNVVVELDSEHGFFSLGVSACPHSFVFFLRLR